MVVLGLLLVILAVAVAAAVIFGSGGTTTLDTLGVSITNLHVAELFLAGAAAATLLLLGLWMMTTSAARKRRKARAHRESERGLERERESLATQKSDLQANLEQERQANLAARPQRMDRDDEHVVRDEVIDVRDGASSDRPVRPEGRS